MISRNFFEIDKEKPLFQLFFLRNNESQTVIVEETEEIDFGNIKEHLEQGESVFITPKRKKKVGMRPVERKRATGTWHFTHI